MNSAEMDAAQDPGMDGYINNASSTFNDYFGMNLEYYAGDYARSGTHVQSYEELPGLRMRLTSITALSKGSAGKRAQPLCRGPLAMPTSS